MRILNAYEKLRMKKCALNAHYCALNAVHLTKQSLAKLKKNPGKIPLEVLKQAKNIEDLENLHSKFIVLFVDKAS